MDVALSATSPVRAYTPPPQIRPQRRYSVAEYIEREIETNQKHTYLNGILIPMAGGTPPHVRIQGNLFFQLTLNLETRPNFEVFSSEMKVHIPVFNFYHYPDCCVVCEKPKFSKDPAQALLNPVLIVEVLSKSTQNYDKKSKFEEYKTIPSFREYVLIEQGKPAAKAWFKNPNGVWQAPVEVFGLDAALPFESVQVSIPMSKIYRHVSFETADMN